MKELSMFILIGMFALYSCSRSNSQYSIGGAMSEPLNPNSTTMIHFRVNQAGIDERSALALMDDLKKWNEDRLPENFPVTDLSKVKKVFLFLYKQEVNNEFTKLTTRTLEGTRELTFYREDMVEFVLRTDPHLRDLNWLTGDGDLVRMTKADQGHWQLDVEGERLIWSVDENKICFSQSCSEI